MGFVKFDCTGHFYRRGVTDVVYAPPLGRDAVETGGPSSFDVAGFAGMSKQMVERVYGRHDPNCQRTVAIGFRATKRPIIVSLANQIGDDGSPLNSLNSLVGPPLRVSNFLAAYRRICLLPTEEIREMFEQIKREPDGWLGR